MPTLASDREERLAAVLDSLAARQQAGQAVDWIALQQAHPDLVDEIRQLLAVGQIVEGLMKSSGATTIALRKSSAPTPSAPLPRPFDRFELVEELGRGGM